MSFEAFEAFDAYPYDQDEEFKLGLSSILQHAQNEEHAQQLERQARSFYFKRKTGTTIDLNAYYGWKLAEQSKSKSKEKPITEPATAGQDVQEPSAIEQSISSKNVLSTTAGGDGSDVRLSYAQIVEMIKDGKENDLPGVKDIPDTVLEGQGTTSTQAQRRKPWEKDAQSAESLSATS